MPRPPLTRTVVALATVLAASACNRSTAVTSSQSGAEPQIRVALAHEGADPLIEVTGVPANDLASLEQHSFTQDEWSALLRVSVAGVARDDANTPAMLGSYSIRNKAIRFKPLYALDPGRPYRVIFSPAHLPPGAEAAPERWRSRPIETTIAEPAAERAPTTTVVAVFPSGDVVPENQLRWYIFFSAPMGLASGVDHVRLLDESGRAVEDPFLPLDVALWNADRTRYTLLADPGRVKRGVRPNEQLGRSIRKGRQYTLVVDRDWLDARGVPLVEPYRREFRGGDPIERSLEPAAWRLDAPAAGTRDPLVVSFFTPLDYALMLSALRVSTALGATVPGEARVEATETRWSFVPRTPWSAGEYRLVALSILEDPAGNRIGRPFEIVASGASPRGVAEGPATVPFRIVARAP